MRLNNIILRRTLRGNFFDRAFLEHFHWVEAMLGSFDTEPVVSWSMIIIS